jgi:hypothetical protein
MGPFQKKAGEKGDAKRVLLVFLDYFQLHPSLGTFAKQLPHAENYILIVTFFLFFLRPFSLMCPARIPHLKTQNLLPPARRLALPVFTVSILSYYSSQGKHTTTTTTSRKILFVWLGSSAPQT